MLAAAVVGNLLPIEGTITLKLRGRYDLGLKVDFP